MGSNLATMLVASGHSVIVLDDLSRGSEDNIAGLPRCRFIKADVRTLSHLPECLKDVDAVVHLAALGSVVESVEDPVTNFAVNAGGTFAVLEALRGSRVRHMIFASTGGALMGNAMPPVDENSLPRPISPYGASKLAGEAYCSAFAHTYGLSVTALRFANVVGPMSWHKKGAVTAFFKSILNGIPISIYGDGAATRDFLYVGDLCQGIQAALELRKPGFHIYHLASGRETSIHELARLTCEVAGVPRHPIHFLDKRLGEVERNFASHRLATDELGFTPRISLEVGLRLTWEWMCERHSTNV